MKGRNPSPQKASGNTFGSELDPFLEFELKMGHVTPTYPGTTYPFFFFFVFTLGTGPRRSLSLNLSDTRVYAPQGHGVRSVPKRLRGKSPFDRNTNIQTRNQRSTRSQPFRNGRHASELLCVPKNLIPDIPKISYPKSRKSHTRKKLDARNPKQMSSTSRGVPDCSARSHGLSRTWFRWAGTCQV